MSRAFALARRALEGLGDWRGRAKAELDRTLAGLQGADAPRASELVYGVVRRRRTLHALLGSVARRSLKGRSGDVAFSLELGAYALVYQGGTHRERAIEDALSILDGGKKPRAHVERSLGALSAALEGEPRGDVEPALVESGRAAPVRRGAWQVFREPVIPLEGASEARRLALLHSYPDELVAAWIEEHRGGAEELCIAGNDPPPLFLRSVRVSPEELVRRLASEDLVGRARPDLGPHVVQLEGGRSGFRESAAFREGLFVVQDATAQEAARLLDPRPGERILDLCSAPGGKTAYLAELAHDEATVLATDVSPGRLRKVEETARRLALRSIATRVVDARRSDALTGERFDAVLVDAPCSNTGVLRRRPEARWRYSPRSQRKIAETEQQILRTALRLAKPGGRLVYSVCSIEPEEGRALVAGAGLVPEREILRLPRSDGGDGGYAALVSLPGRGALS